MRQIDAKNLMRCVEWIESHDKNAQFILEPRINKEGLYESITFLPLIEKTVIGIGNNKLDSIDNVANEAVRLIDEYVKDHPEEEIKNQDFLKDCVEILKEDDNGNLSIYCGPKQN